MKKSFKMFVKNGRVVLLRRTVGLFGEQWESFGNFDDRNCNDDRGKKIIELLNECAEHTESINNNDDRT